MHEPAIKPAALLGFGALLLCLLATVAAAQPLSGFDEARKIVVVADLAPAERRLTTRGGEVFFVGEETVLSLSSEDERRGPRAIFEVLRPGMRLRLELSPDAAGMLRHMAVETQ